jgi:hypothetical protein
MMEKPINGESVWEPWWSALKRRGRCLFFKARARRGASLHSHRPVIRAGFGQGAVAPAMRGVLDIGYVFGKSFVGQGRNVHFLGPNVAADVVWFHESAA